MYKIKIIIGITVLLFFASCSEDFLDLEYKNGYIGENFMKSETQAKEAVVAIYDVLNWRGYYSSGVYVLGDAASDNIENNWGDGVVGPREIAFKILLALKVS